MMDNLFDVQYLVENTDYGTISAIHRLWKKRRMAKNMNRLKSAKKFKDIHDDSVWEESLNLGSSKPDSYDSNNQNENELFRGVDVEDVYADTESSVDGSNKYEHAIPVHVESDTDGTESEMCEEVKQSSEGDHTEQEEKEKESEKFKESDSFDDNKSVSNNKRSETTNESMSKTNSPTHNINFDDKSVANTNQKYQHIIPNQAEDENDNKDTDHLKKVVQIDTEDIGKKVDSVTSKQLEKSQTLIVQNPSDGSCFYHAISRYINVNDRTNEITILDLPSMVKKNVKDYKTKHRNLLHAERKTSKYMRRMINSFIYDNADLLVRLFQIDNLTDDQYNGDLKDACNMLRNNAIESSSSDTKWAGTAQVFALSLLTMTPLTVWVKGIDDKMYVRGTQTAIQLDEMKQILSDDPQLQEELNEVLQTIRVRNDKNTGIHLLLHGYHYETLVLL